MNRLSISAAGPGWLTLSVLLALLSVGCASTARDRAVGKAVSTLLEDLNDAYPDLVAGGGPDQQDRSVGTIIAIQDEGLRVDVTRSLRARAQGLTIVARGPEQQQIIGVLADQLGDGYEQGSTTADGSAQARLADLRQPELGGQQAANLFVTCYKSDLEGGHLELKLLAWNMTRGTLVAQGEGSSDGAWQKTQRYTVFGLRCLAVPFLVIFDIGRTSVDHTFADEKKPTFLGTLGRSLLAILYSPVAIFRSDYRTTGAWIRNDPEAEGKAKPKA